MTLKSNKLKRSGGQRINGYWPSVTCGGGFFSPCCSGSGLGWANTWPNTTPAGSSATNKEQREELKLLRNTDEFFLQLFSFKCFWGLQNEQSHRDDGFSPTPNIDEWPFIKSLPESCERAPPYHCCSTDGAEESGIVRITGKGGSSLKTCSFRMQAAPNWAFSLRRCLFHYLSIKLDVPKVSENRSVLREQQASCSASSRDLYSINK